MLCPLLARKPVPELVSQLLTELVAPELVHELLPQLLSKLADDCGGIDATEGRIHPNGQGRLRELVSVVEAMDSLDRDGAVNGAVESTVAAHWSRVPVMNWRE